MKRSFRSIGMLVLALVLSGCVSGRYQHPEQISAVESAAMIIPTLAVPDERGSLASATILPTWTPEDRRTYPDFTGPSIPDSDSAIPRDYLTSLGLVPMEHGINMYYADVSEYYGHSTTTVFTNYWRLPDGSTGSILGVDQYRFDFTVTDQAKMFLGPAKADLLQYSLRYDVQDLSDELPLGSASFVLHFSREGNHIYVAQFSWGVSVGTVLISGTEEMSQEQAFEIMLLAATSIGFDPNYTGEVDEANRGFDGLLGMWSGRQRGIEILSDGTASLQINSGCCNGVIYELAIDAGTTPVTATILTKEVFGDNPPTETGDVGDSITIRRMPNPEGDYLVLEMPAKDDADTWELTVCQEAQGPCGG